MKSFEEWWKENYYELESMGCIGHQAIQAAWNAAIHAAQEHLIQQARLVAASSLRVLKSGKEVGDGKGK